MKWVKNTLRFWIAGASVFSFLAGWILFANSGKPAPLLPADPANAANQPVVQQLQQSQAQNNSGIVVPGAHTLHSSGAVAQQPFFSGGFSLRSRGS